MDLGGWMVRQGYAIRYTAYAGNAYLPEEAAARWARRGLWAGRFDRPWDWRRGQGRGR
jgi:endonuclease YncB( thermonuclease family)